MEPISVGIIGAGAIVQIAHLPALMLMPDVRVEAICDVDLAKAKQVAARFGIQKSFGDYQCLVSLNSIDAVLVCVPTYLNAAITIAALNTGKHVLCEKPFARNPSEAKLMEETAARQDLILFIGYNHRYRPESSILRNMIASGELGELWHINTGWLRCEDQLELPFWKTDIGQSGGGALMDLGTHLLDTVFWLTNSPPISVRGIVKSSGRRGMIDDFVIANIILESGINVHLMVSWAYQGLDDEAYLNIHATDSFVSFRPLKIFKYKNNKTIDVTPLVESPSNAFKHSYQNELRYFINLIRGVQPKQISCCEGSKLIKLIRLIYESARQQQTLLYADETV